MFAAFHFGQGFDSPRLHQFFHISKFIDLGIEPNAFASGFSPLKNKTFSLVFSAESSSPPFIIRTEKALFCVFEQFATKMHKIQNYKMSSRIYFGILPVGKRNFKLARCCASQEQALYCSLRSSPQPLFHCLQINNTKKNH